MNGAFVHYIIVIHFRNINQELNNFVLFGLLLHIIQYAENCFAHSHIQIE